MHEGSDEVLAVAAALLRGMAFSPDLQGRDPVCLVSSRGSAMVSVGDSLEVARFKDPIWL